MDQWYDAALGRGAGELGHRPGRPRCRRRLALGRNSARSRSVRSAPAVAHRRQPIPVRRLRTFADAQASDAPVTSRPTIVIAAEAGTWRIPRLAGRSIPRTDR